MLALLVPASASATQTTRIIVKRDAGLSGAEQRDIRADAGVRLVDTLRLPRTEVVTAAAADASQAVRDLNKDPDVVYAEIDHTVHAFAGPDYFPYQWALNNTGQDIFDYDGNLIGGGTDDADMDVNEAWDQSRGKGQMVAVVDSGVQTSHPDLAGNIAPGYDWVDRDTVPNDQNGHGTHVAGIIAALNDSQGTVGVAPGAYILPLRVLDASGSGHTSDVAEAFDFAGDQHVRIVNASLGSSSFSQAEHNAIEDHPDTLYVVAAGNDSEDVDANPEYPCAYQDLDNIICVGASDDNDQIASFSNFGATTVDIFAPGDRIVSTYPTNTWAVGGGTSQAAPHVAAEAALILALNPSVDEATLKDTILDTGEDKPAFDTFSVTGKRANALAALDPAVTTADKDGDGVDDSTDNCPSVANAGQADVCATQEALADADSDGDGVKDPDDRCPYQAASPNTAGCPGVAPDQDSDAHPDMFDNCPSASNASQADLDDDGIGDACDPDLDNDAVANGPDNCDANYNPNQADRDGDHIGDACDNDRDGDGRANSADSCPDVAAATPTGCPVVAPGPVDSDGDGIYNPSDGCPYEYAKTSDGCPLPAVTSLSARAKKRHGKTRATISVRSSRAATVQVTVQIRKCKHRHCRWARVTRKTVATAGGRATVTTGGLKRGKYRAVIVLSSSAGRAAAETQSFRVR